MTETNNTILVKDKYPNLGGTVFESLPLNSDSHSFAEQMVRASHGLTQEGQKLLLSFLTDVIKNGLSEKTIFKKYQGRSHLFNVCKNEN